MNIYKVNFKPKYPVPGGLIIKAESQQKAFELACETIKHTKINLGDVIEIDLTDKPQVLFYESGDY